MNIAVITGASSGLGREFVRQIDSIYTHLDEIWVIARRKERLLELSKEVIVKLRILPYDLAEEEGLKELYKLLKKERPVIRILVNSAGYGIIGKFTNSEWKETIGMIHLNCSVLTSITYHCLPYMRNNGRIIQIASSAAFLPQPKFAVYAATKSYVLSFSRALNKELKSRGIFVTAVCPGPVSTEFFHRAEKKEKMAFYKMLVMAKAPDVVRDAMNASLRRKDVAVYGMMMKFVAITAKMLPHKVLLGIFK